MLQEHYCLGIKITLFLGQTEYSIMIKKVDAHNYYRNQAELTKVLTKIGVISDS